MKSRFALKVFFVLGRRALTAERRLQRLERATLEGHLDPKTKKSAGGEEIKDFSRIIATNIHADLNYQKMKWDNLTRLLIGFAGGVIYKLYLEDQADELREKRKKLKDAQSDISRQLKLMNEERENLKEAYYLLDKKLELAESLLKSGNVEKNNLYAEYETALENSQTCGPGPTSNEPTGEQKTSLAAP